MTKYIVSIVICSIMIFGWVHHGYSHEGEDHAAVTETMQTVSALLQEVKDAIEDEAYFVIAEKFMEIAKAFKSLDEVTPPKGSKEEWDTIHGDLIKAAFRGIGACGNEDLDTLQSVFGELTEFMKQGHAIFR